MYKYSQIAGADPVIESHMEKIRKKVANEKHESLVLFGSYGKGEGGFINGNPVNDYDLLLVGSNDQTKKALEELRLPVKLEVLALDSLEGYECNQQLFEIKYASKLISGKPINLPDYNEYDIPFSDALRSLDKRVVSMLIGKYEMMKENPNPVKIMSQICKMIFALGDTILIKRGQFNPSYRSRLLLLNDDVIRELYNIAVSFKVFSYPELNPDELWTLWNQTKEYFRNYMIENQLSTNYSEFLINYDERTEPDMLAQLINIVGASEWL